MPRVFSVVAKRGLLVEVICSADNVKIKNSYTITDKSSMLHVLQQIKYQTKDMFSYKRSVNSWVREWQAHNWAYNKGWWEDHTKDVDLEENYKWYNRFIYFVVSLLYRQ